MKIESYRRGIAFSMIFNVFARSLGFLTSLFVSFYFGTQRNADLYFYCVATVALFVGFLSSFNSTIIIPEAMRLEAREGRRQTTAFVNLFLYIYLLIGLFVTAAVLYAPVQVFLLMSKFDGQTLNSNVAVLYFCAPLFTMNLINTYLMDIATSYKFFTMPMISNMIMNLMAISGIIFFKDILGISSIMAGLVIGNILQGIMLVYMLRHYLAWSFCPESFKIKADVFQNIIFAKFGNLSNVVATYIPMFIMSGMGNGLISGLNYSKQVAEIPNLLATYQFSSVAGIKLNELNALGEHENMNRIFISSSNILLFLVTPVSIFMMIYSSEIISLLFQRGNFTMQSVSLCSMFLKIFALLLPFVAIGTMASKICLATQRIFAVSVYQIFMNLLLIIFSVLGLHMFGGMGYPMALLAGGIINVISFYFFAGIFFSWLKYHIVLRYLLKVFFVNAFIGSGILLLKIGLAGMPLGVNIAAGGIAYAAVLVIVNKKFIINGDANALLLSVIGKIR